MTNGTSSTDCTGRRTLSRRYASKRDSWLVAVLLVTATASVVAAGTLAGAGAPLALKIVLLPACLATAVFLVWCLLATSYELTGNRLIVRCGPLRWNVPLVSIREVNHVRNLASSAALSRDRLELKFHGPIVDLYISPANRDGFMQTLFERCPHLKRRGNRLVQVDGL